MKIVKPASLSLLYRTYKQFGQNNFVTSVLGFFPLGTDRINSLLPEAAQWARLIKFLAHGQVLDEAMPKACAEAIVLGSAYAPNAVPVTTLSVRLKLSTIDKQLTVYGDRTWRYGLLPFYEVSEPAPFVSMPLSFEHAFGGAGYEPNPVGRGWSSNAFPALRGPSHGLMPNIEYSHIPVVDRRNPYPPAAMGPMKIGWKPRVQFAGTYDSKWFKNHFGELPVNLDWRVYNQMPEDQRVEGWFAGDESYRLEGMHVSQPVIEGNLPNFTVRAFAQLKNNALQEVKLVFDTVWFIPTLDIGVACWRGQTPVADSDGLDVTSLMVAYEDIAESPKTLDEYASVMKLRTDKATAHIHAFHEAQLTPCVTQPNPPAKCDSTGSNALKDEILKNIESETNHLGNPERKQDTATPIGVDLSRFRELSKGGNNLSEIMLEVEAIKSRLSEHANGLRDTLREQISELKVNVSYSGANDPIDNNQSSHAQQWQHVLERAAGIDKRSTDMADLIQQSGQIASSSTGRELHALKGKARLASPTPLSPSQVLDPAIALQLGRQIVQWVSDGVALMGRDFSGANLTGAQLSGVDFSDCFFEFADLTGLI